MNEHFTRANMAGAMFEETNLAGAQFLKVNLAGGSIRNANLQDFHIRDANIDGLTVLGFDIGKLIDEEMDRRDPERTTLRIADYYDPVLVRSVMERVERQRSRFISILRTARHEALMHSPDPREWNTLQIVRHLLFAEDLYINHLILQNDKPFNPHGLLPDHMRDWPDYQRLVWDISDDLEAVLTAWDSVHAATKLYVDTLTVEILRHPATDEGKTKPSAEILEGLGIHELTHIRQAEQALAVAPARE